MQRLGREVRAAPTAQLSNHTGPPDWGGGPLGAAPLRDVFDGLERSAGFAGLDAALTGYIGDADSVAAAARAIGRAAGRRPPPRPDPPPSVFDGRFYPPRRHSASLARAAPSTSDSSFAQAMSGSTLGSAAKVAKPQSEPAITRSRPTTPA